VTLIRLPRHQHPKPPHHELRQKRVLDSGAASSVRWRTSTSMTMGSCSSWT
jgi:hypothetical protein